MRGFSSTIHEMGDEGAMIAERARMLAEDLEPFACDFEIEPLETLWFVRLRVDGGMRGHHTFRDMDEDPLYALERVFAAASDWVSDREVMAGV